MAKFTVEVTGDNLNELNLICVDHNNEHRDDPSQHINGQKFIQNFIDQYLGNRVRDAFVFEVKCQDIDSLKTKFGDPQDLKLAQRARGNK